MISNTPPNFANAVAPFNPLGRQPVGEETGENRNTPLAPVIETIEPDRNENQRAPDERRGEVEQRIANDGRRDERAAQESSRVERDQQEQRQLEEDQQVIRQLAERDREVRAHEQAHAAVGGKLAGAPSYTFERGPDGKSYAVGGEVPISLGEVTGNPELTIINAQRVQKAALAPAEPSSQDRRVAASAAQIEIEARQDVARITQEEAEVQRTEQEAIREERLQAEEQREEERREKEREDRARDEQALSAQRDSAQSEISGRSVDINQRLLEIGVSEPAVNVGALLNQQV